MEEIQRRQATLNPSALSTSSRKGHVIVSNAFDMSSFRRTMGVRLVRSNTAALWTNLKLS